MAASTMAMAGSSTGSLRVVEKAAGGASLSSSAAIGRVAFRPARVPSTRRSSTVVKAAKELHFNKDGSAIKRMQVRNCVSHYSLNSGVLILILEFLTLRFLLRRLELTSLRISSVLPWVPRDAMSFWRASTGRRRL